MDTRRVPPARQSRDCDGAPERDAQDVLAAERALLCAMMLDRAAIERARGFDAPAFHQVAHAKIFRAMFALADRGEGVDFVTVGDELRRAGELDAVGGPPALSRIFESAGACANVAAYRGIIEESARKRRLRRLALDLQ